MSDKELERLQKEIEKRQEKIDKINAKKDKIKLKFFERFLAENNGEHTRNLLKCTAKKLSKSEQKQLAQMYDWLDQKSPNGTAQNHQVNTPQNQGGGYGNR